MIDAYIINLANAKERREKMEQEIASLGNQNVVRFHFYEAISWQSKRFLDYKKFWNWDLLTKLYRGKKLSNAEKACYASHYSLWEKCIKDNMPILVLEDDIVFLEGFIEQIERIVSKDVDFVRLMSFFRKKMSVFDEHLNLTKENICGTQGYYLTPQGAKKIIKKSKIWFCPVDNFLDKNYLHTLPNLISSPEVIREEALQSCIGGVGRNRKPSIPFIISRELSASFEFVWRKIYEYTH